MKTLRQVMDCVKPAGQINSLRGLAPLLRLKRNGPTHIGVDLTTPISLRQVLEEGSNYKSITKLEPPLRFMEYNLAFFPTSLTIELSFLGITIEEEGLWLYKGCQRDLILPTIVSYLKDNTPDIVGFCELWIPRERHELYSHLQDIYPYFFDTGYHETVEIDKFGVSDFEAFYDSGLMLLSRYPFVDKNVMSYPFCMGEDCFVSKGVIHVRIEVPGHPTQYDIFLTHTQSCEPEYIDDIKPRGGQHDCSSTLTQQILALASFISQHRSPDRPALLMGDLNVNGLDTAAYGSLIANLQYPLDLWIDSGRTPFLRPDAVLGITCDSASNFDASLGRPYLDPEDKKRHKSGTRLDYFFSWPTDKEDGKVSPLYEFTSILPLQCGFDDKSQGGFDISDHYGLETQLICIREFE